MIHLFGCCNFQWSQFHTLRKHASLGIPNSLTIWSTLWSSPTWWWPQRGSNFRNPNWWHQVDNRTIYFRILWTGGNGNCGRNTNHYVQSHVWYDLSTSFRRHWMHHHDDLRFSMMVKWFVHTYVYIDDFFIMKVKDRSLAPHDRLKTMVAW